MHATRVINVHMVLASVVRCWTGSRITVQAYSLRQTGTETQAARLHTSSNALCQPVLQQL